jgi:hypothetical protein
MTTMNDEPDLIPDLEAAREGCELAKTCAWLAIAISVAILLANFGPEPADLVSAREQVVVHRTILREHETLLRQNEAALLENQTLLQARRR